MNKLPMRLAAATSIGILCLTGGCNKEAAPKAHVNSDSEAAVAEQPTVKKIMELYPPEGLVDMYKIAANG